MEPEQSDIDHEALEWIQQQAKKEAERLKEYNVRALILSPKNYSLVKSKNHDPPYYVNRIEIASNFDFEKRIKQILVSEPIDYKDDAKYVNVMLLTDRMDIPLLLPYIYKQENDLKEWLFINSVGQRARHSIDKFHEV